MPGCWSVTAFALANPCSDKYWETGEVKGLLHSFTAAPEAHRLQELQPVGFSSCGSRALEDRLHSCGV